MSEADFLDESLAPPVDDELLIALVRRQLSRDEARDVYELIYSFRSWNAAHNRILITESRTQNSNDDADASN